jgi:uncharacterized membrane protein (Fun14 family)
MDKIMGKLKDLIKTIIFVVGVWTICVFLFDYNNGKITFDLPQIWNNFVTSVKVWLM